MKCNKYAAFLGLLIASPWARLEAKELVLASVPVTFTLTQKEPTGAVYPRDQTTGKELRGEELTSSSEYTIINADGSTRVTSVWGLKTVISKISIRELILEKIEEGEIAGPLAGWAIMASPTISFADASWTVSYKIYFARGSETSDWFTISVTDAELANSGSSNQTISTSGILTARNGSGTQTFEKPFVASVEGSQLAGLFSCATKSISYAPNASYPSVLQSLQVPGAAKISNFLVAHDDDGYVAGTIVFGASRAISAP